MSRAKIRPAAASLGLACVFALTASAQPAPPDTLHLTLADAEKLALQNNPAFSSAKFLASAAGQVPAEVRSALQPSMTGNLTGVGADSGSRLAAGALNNPVVYNRLGAGVAASQLITDFGRTRNLASSAQFHASAQDQISETVRANILLATDRAYFAVLRAQSILTVSQQTVSARQLVSDQITQLANAKLKSLLDVSFANVNLADARLQLADARNGLKAAFAELSAALGLPGQQQFSLGEEGLPDAPPDQIAPLLQEAIQKRPELANLRLNATAAERFLDAEKALYYPTIGVVGAAGIVPAGQAQVPGRYGAIGANVSIPVFNGGLFKARRTEAEYRVLAARKDVEDRENLIARDVRVAYLNALNAYERIGLTQQLLEQAKLALDLAQGRYDLGLSSIVELSQAQLNYTSAQIANSSAKYDYQTQHSVLEFQVGALR